MQLHLNSALDRIALAQQYAQSGRLQISDFLEARDARALADSFNAIDWRLVLNSGDRHIDLQSRQVAAMEPARQAAILAEVKRNAAHQFQYLYDNYPVFDEARAGRLSQAPLKAIFSLMNSQPVRDLLTTITGESADFCDMQATRYAAGHFLTVHSDDAPGKNRKLGYVLSLTDGWSPTWGGQLQFLNGDEVTDSFVPRFNALSVFMAPTTHHVTQVANFAPRPRFSLTGWYRTNGEA